jgi:hypothetical protein
VADRAYRYLLRNKREIMCTQSSERICLAFGVSVQ